MEPIQHTSTGEHRRPGSQLLLETVERSAGTAFSSAGVFMLASVVVPVALSAVTDLAWTSGLALIGLAVVAVSLGVFGLSRRLESGSTVVALGAVAAGFAGLVAAGWVVAVGLVVTGAGVWELAVPRPMGLFRWTALAMATGFGLGYLLVGVGAARDGGGDRRLGHLMAAGGAALLVPVVVALVGPVVAVELPGWLLFGVLGVVALDTLGIGWRLRTRPSPA